MKSHHYKRICKLGKGSFGDVQLIENIESKKLYALKRLDIANNELPSVLNEVILLQQLDHPNIIKYHEYFRDTSKFCIVMEYADNGDLYNQVNETKKNKTLLSESTILNWFSQLCLALSFLHKRHIIHRDIKLQNIFLNKEGLIKIGDFGVSKKLENTDDLAKTSLGTPYYISPEICQGRSYNNKSDVWMLGCVLYELCTLERAFNAYSLHTLVKKIVEEGHQKITQKYSGFLKGLIDQMLEKDPEKRPKICEILERKEIKSELKNLLNKHPRVYGNIIEKKEETHIRDNKSISFHDYLIKKRDSLADDDQIERNNPNKNPYDLVNNKEINNDPFPNLMTKKNAQNKTTTLNLKNTTNFHPSATILSRKISLPNEISNEKNDKSNLFKENSTVKNKKALELPIQAYFQKVTNKTPNFNYINNTNVNNVPKETNHLKTPQTNYDKKFGDPHKRVVDLNLDESYFQDQYNQNLNQSFMQNGDKQDSLRQNSSRLDTYKIDSNKQLQKQKKQEPNKQENLIKPISLKKEVSNYEIHPIYSVSPKYVSPNYKPFSGFEKDLNKENLGYLANLNSRIIKKGQNEEKINTETKKSSINEMNVSFDEFSKKNERETKNTEEMKTKESTKRSISVHISSKAALENLLNPPNKFSNFSEFLKQKHIEKTQKEKSFISFLEKQKIEEFKENRDEGKKEKVIMAQKKHDLLKQILSKMLGEKKFNLLLSILQKIEGKNDPEIDRSSLSQFDEIMGECNRGVILMLQDMCKTKEHNRCQSVMPSSFLLE